jgi:hypothetical protein
VRGLGGLDETDEPDDHGSKRGDQRVLIDDHGEGAEPLAESHGRLGMTPNSISPGMNGGATRRIGMVWIR